MSRTEHVFWIVVIALIVVFAAAFLTSQYPDRSLRLWSAPQPHVRV